jgi:Fe-S cluster biogenesis protein NfuA
MDDAEARAQAERVESLLASLERLTAPEARTTATAAVQAVVELYGEALARIVHRLAQSGPPGMLETLVGDELVSNMLLVHGLHPHDLDARARRALESLAPSLAAHGVRAELVGVDGGVARVAVHGHRGGCGALSGTLERTIEEALLAAAPDLERVHVDHLAAPVLLQIGVRPSVNGASAR